MGFLNAREVHGGREMSLGGLVCVSTDGRQWVFGLILLLMKEVGEWVLRFEYE